MGQSIDENERECVRIASNVLEKKQRNSIEPLATKVINYFSNSFSGGAGISKIIGLSIYLLIQLPIAILFTPLGIPFLIGLHIDEHRLARRIGKRYLTYSKPERRHIFLLWDKYGLNDIYMTMTFFQMLLVNGLSCCTQEIFILRQMR
jgi:hypothetical protein